MSDLKRTAVITGAAQGIGRKTAEILAERGYRLGLMDLRMPEQTLESLGADAFGFAGSVTDEPAVEQFAREVHLRWGAADVVVNNAGISFIAPADIINVASVAGLLGIADRAAYNASKHGLIGLTRTLAAEWGGRGVRVNAVCPGWVKTEMDTADQSPDTYQDSDITGRVPMGRFASPDDIARAIAFLADERESGFVNGHTLTVDGGWTADGSWESLRLRRR